ncbi:hypothetical protein [Methylotenera sp. 1P/1]|uniref:hypothetical protein n=1 Tax=Methylotenera sp. 1P/1 TaxID=1131551 RepID=UPI000372599C|nr:hypothetical protein [Methylotenera sp. 1P/1]
MKENKFIKQYLDNNNIEVIEGKFYNKNTKTIKKTVQLLDDKEFLKVFINANSVLSELKNSSKLVFEYIFKCLQASSSFNKTEIEVNYKHYVRFCRYNNVKALCEKSFYLARKQLIELDIIDETDERGIYFFNLNFFFNGNRLTVINNYVRATNKEDTITFEDIINDACTDSPYDDKEPEKMEYKKNKKSAFQS